MAHLTNFSFEFFYEIFTEDASLLLLYHGAKTSKVTSTNGSKLKLQGVSKRAPFVTHTVDNTNTLSPIRFSNKTAIFLENWLKPGPTNFSAFCAFVKALIRLTILIYMTRSQHMLMYMKTI